MRSLRVHISTGRGEPESLRLARELERRLANVTTGAEPDPEARVHYRLERDASSPRVSEIEIAHGADPAPGPDVADRALCMDACVVARPEQADRLREQGAREVRVIGTPAPDAAEEAWGEWASAHDRLFADLELTGGCIAPPQPEPLRVFISGDASEREHRGGPSVRMEQTAAALRRLGHAVEIGSLLEAGSGFDVAHVFNTWPAESSLARVEAARAAGVAVVLSPIYMDHRETSWARRVLRGGSPRTLRGIRGAVALARLRFTPASRRARVGGDLRRYRELVPRMVALADHVALLSHAELEGLRELGCEPASKSFVWNTVDPAPFAGADPALFRREHGLGDYVLCVGRLEFRKNQALLLHAMRDAALEVALIGSCISRRYGRAIEALSGPGVVRVAHLPAGGPMLTSAFAGASAFVLPSWAEGAPIAALEAAAAGVPLVLGDRAGVREYFGRLAHYCEPGDPRSIRAAVEAAIAEDAPSLRARRRALVSGKLTLDGSARSTAAAYGRALERAAHGRPLREERAATNGE